MIADGGKDRGERVLGIYKLEKDRLTTCMAAPGKPRPKEFKAEKGSGSTLRTFIREKTPAKTKGSTASVLRSQDRTPSRMDRRLQEDDQHVERQRVELPGWPVRHCGAETEEDVALAGRAGPGLEAAGGRFGAAQLAQAILDVTSGH